MLKKFLTCFSLLLVMAFAGTASAKPVQLTGITAFDLNNETVRIEISYKDGKLDSSNVVTNLRNGLLRVELDNTLQGRVSRVAGTEIQSGARDFVEKILANQTQEKHTSVQIHFRAAVAGDVKVSLEPAVRSEKKDARIVLDVRRYVASKDGTGMPFVSDGTTTRTRRNSRNSYNSGNKIVVLDPGHGGSDSGAVGPTGVTEKSVSLAVSLKAQRLLTNAGYQVVMTRTTDIDVAAPGVPDARELQARVDKAPPDADLFISVHCNAYSNHGANGMETYHAPNAVKGARLARLLNEELERLGGLNNRGVKSARFYVMTHSKCPASLIELGFITNYREEKLLASNDYQQKLAQAITNAVNRYFNQGGLD